MFFSKNLVKVYLAWLFLKVLGQCPRVAAEKQAQKLYVVTVVMH
jgi:hypothetical protein